MNHAERLASLSPEQRDIVLKKLRERKTQSEGQPEKSANSPLRRVDRNGDLPVSFGQRRLLFLDQLEGPNPYYNEFGAHRIHGNLDASALETALSTLIERHEILRTTFPASHGEPIQRIAPQASFILRRVDFSSLSQPEFEPALAECMDEEASHPFQLAKGPLLRASLISRNENESILLTTMHHIVCDNWSSEIFNRELIALYLGLVGKESASLPPLSVQYADFSSWQRKRFDHGGMDSQLEHWRGALGALPPPLELPTDRRRPEKPSSDGFNVPLEWEPELVDALKGLGRRHGATLFMVALAAYAVLLARYSCQEELVIGTPISNRNQKELESLIGFFVNTLLLKIDLRGNPTFEELIGRVVQTAKGAYQNQDLPLEKVSEALGVKQGTPLFRAMVIFQNAPRAALSVPGLSIEPIEKPSDAVRSDMDFYLMEDQGALKGQLRCNRDLFDRKTIETFRTRLRRVLEGYVLASTVPLDDLQFERTYRLPEIPKRVGAALIA